MYSECIVHYDTAIHTRIKHWCECTMGNIARGACREGNTARGKAECCIGLRDTPQVQYFA